MANEAQIRSGLSIRITDTTTNLVLQEYRSNPVVFLANVSTTGGPCPGMVSVSTNGTDVDLSKLAKPGLCRIMNLDPTNYVDVGLYEPTTGVFYPLMELMPGETYVIRLSRNLGEQVSGTVTGTGTDAVNNTVRLRANGASCKVLFEAFEK